MERSRGHRMNSSLRRGMWLAVPLALSILLSPAGRALAQAIADQLAACKREGGGTPARIAACGWVIDNAKDDEDIRVEARLQRGVLHESAGDKDAAIADYSAALA